jgi:hypothetical protein
MSRRRVTRQRGGVDGKLENMGAFAALFAKRGGPPNLGQPENVTNSWKRL